MASRFTPNRGQPSRSGCQDPMALAYGGGRFANRAWRRGREAEGDGLLNRYRGNPIVGSNPTVSAKLLFQKRNTPVKAPENPIISEGFATAPRTSQTARASQIRSETPVSLIPGEPRQNWFGRKFAMFFNVLKILGRCPVLFGPLASGFTKTRGGRIWAQFFKVHISI